MRKAVYGAILLILLSLPSTAEVKLVLEDGTELVGRSVKRDGSLYLLQQVGENVLSVPVELVAEVVEERPAPTGIKLAEPETLVGPPDGINLPTVDEQTAVLLGSRSVFRKGVIDPTWVPTSDWDPDPRRNNFNPARWYQPPIDPSWTPVSGLGEDVTEFNPARWYRAPIDSTWWPRAGFSRRY